MSENQKEEIKIDYIKLFRNICLSIIGITILYFLLVNFISPSDNRNETRGTFGDLFGGLNAIFSGFAFAGVIITILMQMKELELTREELRKSVEAQDKSQKALNLQLKNMQSTTRIESVKNIIETYSHRDESDKKEVAKSILEKLVEDVFYDQDFLQMVKPIIEITKEPKLQGPKKSNSRFVEFEKYDKTKSNQIVIEFENKGASYIINDTTTTDTTKDKINVKYSQIVTKSSGGSTTTSYPALKNGNLIERNSRFRMIINNFKDQKELRIGVSLEGDFVKHKYEQHIYINRTGSSIQTQIGLSEQINTDDNK